ncbi:hypothetical protein E2C01_032418 [Portunus trituberculatus]|uniref:Uncharacterized protein n=1 Tax=Portunus trituberculatus TaxID=210409 RepID=A0A5B7EVY7_PORTR|nr:hypothetical protein [Portunus trituberculatus]
MATVITRPPPPTAPVASPSLTSTTSSLSPLSSLASPPQHPLLPSPQASTLTQTLFVARTPLPHALTTPPLQNSAPGKDQSKSRKKSKVKSQPKARTIKFHEYKGPPSAVKREASSNNQAETSYDILLQQQQLFLQCQLELKQKIQAKLDYAVVYSILFPELNPQEVRQRSPLIGRYSSSLPLGLILQHHLLDR